MRSSARCGDDADIETIAIESGKECSICAPAMKI